MGRKGVVAVQAAQPKLPPAKMVDSKYPSIGYYYGSSWRYRWNAFVRGKWVLAQAYLLNLDWGSVVQKPYCLVGPTQAIRQTSTCYPTC